MSVRFEAPGLTADWLNGWLAAVGATVLVPDLRLAWTDEPVPSAVFERGEQIDLVPSLALALPTEESLRQSPIARELAGCHAEFTRNVTLEAFRERVALERATGGFHVAASISDLRADVDCHNLDHGAFDPPAPRGETLWSRAVSCARAVQDRMLDECVRATLEGRAPRVQLNGLGFDARRLPSGLHGPGPGSKVYADPVVELLCFAALALFPTRGDGRVVRQRGWRERSTQRGALEWLAWRPFLDRWAIDALLDMPAEAGGRVAITRFRVVPYQPGGSNDTTRAYFAERVP